MALTGKILKGVLRGSLKINLDEPGAPEGSVSTGFQDLHLPEYLRDTDDRILVFDDLERCGMPIEKVLGYCPNS